MGGGVGGWWWWVVVGGGGVCCGGIGGDAVGRVVFANTIPFIALSNGVQLYRFVTVRSALARTRSLAVLTSPQLIRIALRA